MRFLLTVCIAVFSGSAFADGLIPDRRTYSCGKVGSFGWTLPADTVNVGDWSPPTGEKKERIETSSEHLKKVCNSQLFGFEIESANDIEVIIEMIDLTLDANELYLAQLRFQAGSVDGLPSDKIRETLWQNEALRAAKNLLESDIEELKYLSSLFSWQGRAASRESSAYARSMAKRYPGRSYIDNSASSSNSFYRYSAWIDQLIEVLER